MRLIRQFIARITRHRPQRYRGRRIITVIIVLIVVLVIRVVVRIHNDRNEPRPRCARVRGDFLGALLPLLLLLFSFYRFLFVVLTSFGLTYEVPPLIP